MAMLILSNAWNVVNAVFDVAQQVVSCAAGVIVDSTDVNPSMIDTLRSQPTI